MNVLVVDDDAETRDYLAENLRERGHAVQACVDGVEGLECARDQVFDVVIVDRKMPRLDGIAMVKAVRTSAVPPPILMLTAMGAIADRVSGLEAGADDYLVKPFSFAELHARLEILARRLSVRSETMRLEVGDLVIDRLARTVKRGERPITLQPREYRLLEVLMLNAERVVTRAMILEKVWNFNFDPGTNIVQSHICRLRAKVDLPGEKELIRTVWNEGYVVRAD
jgi:two-component system OmpR family response regulator